MLKIASDITLKFDGKEIECKDGDTVKIGKKFGLEGQELINTELRFSEKYSCVERVAEKKDEKKAEKEVESKTPVKTKATTTKDLKNDSTIVNK